MARLTSALILLLIAAGLPANPSKSIVYLLPGQEYTMLEMIEYADQANRFYIRNERFGRFVNAQDRNWIVSREYFESIREGSRTGAAFRSLLFFNANAAAVHPYEPDVNHRSTAIKIGLLAVTGLSFFDASHRARAAHKSIQYVNHSSRVRAFEHSRNQFYLAGSATIGYHLFTAAKAYMNFGHSVTGLDLQIPQRSQVEGDQILNTPDPQVLLQTTLPLNW